MIKKLGYRNPNRYPGRISGAFIAAAFATALLTAGASDAAQKKYVIDPAHLSIGFLVDHAGYGKVLGMFRKAKGEVTFDEETKTLSAATVVIDTESVFSNHEKRDEHLRSPDFLNAGEFPDMTFTLTGSSATGDTTGTVEGELELLGRKHPVTLDVTLNKAAEYPFGGGLFGAKPYALGISARGSFKRSTFGMTYGVEQGWVGDEIELIIEFEAVREE
ncbi:MAG: YceI family protein [Proteobacteria bacterium]|nr:YceI family protein [Pseudomonadota bacterium]